jgi:polyisoprenoid-binding protein YceI
LHAISWTLIVFLALAGSACKKKETPSAPKPSVAPAAPSGASAPAATASIPPGRYLIDNVHSAILFKAKHFGAGYTYAWFKDFEGSFTVDPDPTKSAVEVTVKTASVESRVEKRDHHLRSPDFFNAAQFPTATFKSKTVSKAADGTWNVSGDLTLRGQTRPVTAKVTLVGSGKDPKGSTLAGVEATLTVPRHDFGVSFMKGALGDNIEVTIALEGILQ